MPLIRPEASAALLRWREVALSLGVVALGLWLVLRPGLFYNVLGGAVLGLGFGLSLTAWRRLRFARPVTAVGVVEVDEGQVSYFGPETGGLIALPDLARIEIRPQSPDRAWHLVQQDGHSLTIPVAAQGTELLYDVFGALPAARAETFIAALSGPVPTTSQTLWRRAPLHKATAIRRP